MFPNAPEVILEATCGGCKDALVVAVAVIEAALEAPNGLDEGLCPTADALGDLGQAAVDELDRVFRAPAAVVVVVDFLQR